jgi:hypothetical protein
MRLPTENAAYKRLTAARLARKYPGILVALYDGRLHLRGVLTLAPHLTPAIADELVAAALDKTCFELEVMLAQRFPRPDMPERLDAIAALAAPLADSLAPGRVETTVPDGLAHGQADSRPAGPAHQLVSMRFAAAGSRARSAGAVPPEERWHRSHSRAPQCALASRNTRMRVSRMMRTSNSSDQLRM